MRKVVSGNSSFGIDNDYDFTLDSVKFIKEEYFFLEGREYCVYFFKHKGVLCAKFRSMYSSKPESGCYIVHKPINLGVSSLTLKYKRILTKDELCY